MTQRIYTASEIDELRKACTLRWLYGTSRARGRIESVPAVEEVVRTYMKAGVTAEALYAADPAVDGSGVAGAI